MTKGYVREVFTSIQGEGIFVGRRQTFVRFAGCNLRCSFCDTPLAQEMKGHFYNGGKKHNNPVDLDFLVDRITDDEVSLTGGEPLFQPEFLLALAKKLKRRGVKTYLETNGTIFKPLAALLPYIDVIAMDFKIPSSTGEAPRWKVHETFLRQCHGKKCFVKITVDKNLRDSELRRVISIIRRADKNIPLVIQPVWLGEVKELLRFQQIASRSLTDVRIVPQLHRLLKIK